MGIFSRFRKRGDFIDLTELKKRGLLKVPKTVPDYVEIGKPRSSAVQEQAPFGFFGAIASSAAPETETDSYSNSINNSGELDSTLESRKERLKRRFSEMQDKVEKASSDIYGITQRLELIEKKLDRM